MDKTSRAHTLLTTALAVLLVAALATSGWLWWQGRDPDESAPALTTARTAAVTFFTLDWTDVDKDIDRMLAMTTGSFRTSYGHQRKTLAEGIEKKKATITSKVPESGVALEYLSGTRAQVLVAVNSTTRVASGGSETSSYRTRVQLTRVDDRWLVSGLEQVG